jgi:hypothetical protein
MEHVDVCPFSDGVDVRPKIKLYCHGNLIVDSNGIYIGAELDEKDEKKVRVLLRRQMSWHKLIMLPEHDPGNCTKVPACFYLTVKSVYVSAYSPRNVIVRPLFKLTNISPDDSDLSSCLLISKAEPRPEIEMNMRLRDLAFQLGVSAIRRSKYEPSMIRTKWQRDKRGIGKRKRSKAKPK